MKHNNTQYDLNNIKYNLKTKLRDFNNLVSYIKII